MGILLSIMLTKWYSNQYGTEIAMSTLNHDPIRLYFIEHAQWLTPGDASRVFSLNVFTIVASRAMVGGAVCWPFGPYGAKIFFNPLFITTGSHC